MADARTVELEFGRESLRILLPAGAEVLRASAPAPLREPFEAIRRSLEEPIAARPLRELAGGKSSAVVVVSDATRPVPYRGEQSILRPVMDTLQSAGIGEITILVACGTHRAMTPQELSRMLDESAFRPGVCITNHDAADRAGLELLGSTERTPRVTVNRSYLRAGLKVLTGLVEPHFMAGFSGGRKAICPGICGTEVTHGFHSAEMLDDPRAQSLLLEGNPCHEESLRIARMAGADFAVNVTLDRERRITGVFSGDMEEAHRRACAACARQTSIPLSRPYDLVLIPGGYVAINHYQAAKAAVEGARALRPGGSIILPADFTDPDPIGKDTYGRMLRMLRSDGAQGYLERIRGPSWTFVPDQWEVQMWARVFRHLGGFQRLYTCSHRLAGKGAQIPETNVADLLPRSADEDNRTWVQRMVQATLDRLAAPDEGRAPSVAVLPDGPYAVPVLSTGPQQELLL